MRSLLCIFLISTIIDNTNAQSVTFDSFARQIFFNADVTKRDTNVISFYKSLAVLSLKPKPKGRTTYPPLAALRQESNSEEYVFTFTLHPYLSFKFRDAELIIKTYKEDDTNKISSSFIKLYFNTKTKADAAYQLLVNRFTAISTRKRFSSYSDTKTAEFTDDNSKSIKAIGFLEGKGDIPGNGYVIVFGLGNDMDIDKK